MLTFSKLRHHSSALLPVVSGQILAALGTFLGGRLITEFIAPQLFGQYKLAIAGVSLCAGLFARPVLQYAMRAYHDLEVQSGDVASVGGLRRFVGRYTFALSAAVGLLLLLLDNPWQISGLTVCFLAAFFLLQTLLEFERGNAVTSGRHAVAGYLGVASAWLLPVGIVLAAILKPSLTSVLLASITVLGGIYAVYWRLAFQPLVVSRAALAEWHGSHGRPALRFAWPLVFVGLFNWVVHESDRFFLEHFGEISDVGIYSAAYGLMSVPFVLLAAMLIQFMYPIVFASHAADSAVGVRGILRGMLFVTAFIGVVGVGLVWLFPEQIVWLALGEEYRAGAMALLFWIAIGYAALGIAQCFDLSAYGAKKTGDLMLAYGVAASVNVTLNLLWIPELGPEGAAKATAAALVCYLLVMAGLYLWRASGSAVTLRALEETDR